jgi:D-sedoheptulose 7-phosphate isomerase
VRMHNTSSAAQPVLHDALPMLRDRQRVIGEALDALCLLAEQLDAAASAMISCLRSGGRILVAGNGGSAAESQHFATEMVGRFLRERTPYAVISLTADTAILTAIANDYGYESVFARQVGAYGRTGDVFVGFSTSGRSPNLINAVEIARECGITVIAITGSRANSLADMADISIRVPAEDTPVIQELHTVVLHVLCELVEAELASPDEGLAAS